VNTRIRIVTLSAGAALAVSLAACGLHGRPRVERESRSVGPTVEAMGATASATDSSGAAAGAWVAAPGIVEPWNGEVFLSTEEGGWISQVLVREGDAVRAGQLLVTLADAEQRHAVRLAQAEVDEARAALARIEHGPTDEELRQARADYEAARARAEFAESTSGRVARLKAGGSISDNDADRATSEALAQRALAESARARLAELERGARKEDREAASARLESALAGLQMAEAALARRSVASPVDGTVLLSRFRPGEFYGPGPDPIVILGDMTRLRVRLEVDEVDAPDIAVGAAARLYSDGGALLGTGTVIRLAPRMGRRVLPIESPTARADVRVREVFVEILDETGLVPGQRVWGHTARTPTREPR